MRPRAEWFTITMKRLPRPNLPYHWLCYREWTPDSLDMLPRLCNQVQSSAIERAVSGESCGIVSLLSNPQLPLA